MFKPILDLFEANNRKDGPQTRTTGMGRWSFNHQAVGSSPRTSNGGRNTKWMLKILAELP